MAIQVMTKVEIQTKHNTHSVTAHSTQHTVHSTQHSDSLQVYVSDVSPLKVVQADDTKTEEVCVEHDALANALQINK